MEACIKQHGFKPLPEYVPKNYINQKERIDVAYYDGNKKIFAFEVTLSTDSLISNIIKCINMQAHKIIIVTELPKDKKGIQQRIENEITDKDILAKISLKPVSWFIPKKSNKQDQIGGKP